MARPELPDRPLANSAYWALVDDDSPTPTKIDTFPNPSTIKPPDIHRFGRLKKNMNRAMRLLITLGLPYAALYHGVTHDIKTDHFRISTHFQAASPLDLKGLAGFSVFDTGFLGDANSDTHDGPVINTVSVKPKDIKEFNVPQIVSDPKAEYSRYNQEILSAIEQDRSSLLWSFAGVGLLGLAASAGGLSAIYSFNHRNPQERSAKKAMINITAPIVMTALLGMSTSAYIWSTVDESPNTQYSGLLAYGQNSDNIPTELSGIADVIGNAFSRAIPLWESASNLRYLSGETTTNVLFTTDESCLPDVYAGLRNIVEGDGVHIDFIVDTGNFISENHVLSQFCLHQLDSIGEFSEPFLFTLGPQDTPNVRSRLLRLDNTYPIDSQVQSFADVQILGRDDPASFEDVGQVEESLPYQRKQLALALSLANSGNSSVDIVGINNLSVAHDILGQVPLIFSGRARNPGIRNVHGSIVVAPGTTGGGGIDGHTDSQYATIVSLDKETSAPIAATLIRLDAGQDGLNLDIKSFFFTPNLGVNRP